MGLGLVLGWFGCDLAMGGGNGWVYRFLTRIFVVDFCGVAIFCLDRGGGWSSDYDCDCKVLAKILIDVWGEEEM